jgi:glutathione S-transferase
MTAEAAFEVAKASKPAPVTHLSPHGDPGGLRQGTAVRITPDDNARVPVEGTLVAADAFDVVIHRHDDQAGDLHIHFPRLGYTVTAV